MDDDVNDNGNKFNKEFFETSETLKRAPTFLKQGVNSNDNSINR